MENQHQLGQPDASASRLIADGQELPEPEVANTRSVSPLRELKVCNLDECTDEQDLTHLFSGMGEVEKLELVNAASSNGCPEAYVTFKDPSVASEALRSLNGQLYNGKTLMLSWAEKGGMHRRWYRIFVGNISREVDNEKLVELFEPFGRILRAQVVCEQPAGTSRGFGFVTYDTFESAKTAIESMNKIVVGETALETNWAVLRRRDTEDDLKQHPKYYNVFNATFPGNSTIYVGNLPEDVPKDSTEKLLHAAFRKYGQIKKVSVSDCVKYAFVVLDSKASATCAIIGMNGKALCSAGQADAGNLKPVRVNWANNQYQDTGSRGRFTRANYGYDEAGNTVAMDIDGGYSNAGFWTANGRTRSLESDTEQISKTFPCFGMLLQPLVDTLLTGVPTKGISMVAQVEFQRFRMALIMAIIITITIVEMEMLIALPTMVNLRLKRHIQSPQVAMGTVTQLLQCLHLSKVDLEAVATTGSLSGLICKLMYGVSRLS
ncbi:Nucleolysin TIAR [Orchesella cincta]|uniref:Nucleolysin TIAR n=1 Tax=Orchesella cincta TaxID=48709 RepID=A0A1D2MJN8_ORCCI|nr:Nucleolysin TIAR [Orchesella cincta]